MATTQNSRPAGDRDQAGDIHESIEATGGTGNEREVLPAGADLDRQPSNLQKDPDDWTTGDESMTDAQRSYLTTLSQEAGEDPPGDLTKAEASKRIDELQRVTGRGLDR
ncbi:MAG TPA: DUF3072 domain-containing protein [Luteitalea sp.]|nr:DUF3072 domain-containing protein [Luteitalea sp.]